ncbi:MAG: hypothetical protein GY871_00880 [Actinomycetales bacterium]|nr:hypothetical protein [Actinomycetales bacterium]
MAAGSVVTLDNPVNDTNRLVIDKQWIESQVLPELSAGTGRTSVYIGFEAASPNWADGVAEADFLLAVEILCDVSDRANNRFKYRVWRSGSLVTTVTVTGLTNAIYDLVFINDDGDIKFGALVEATGNDPTTYLYDVSDASWTMEAGLFGYAVADRDLYIGTIGTTMDLSTSGISEVAEPAAPTNLTSWDKAVDFSGSSERAQIANSSYVYNPMMMGATSQTVSAPAAGKTVNVGYPWATACVFKNDGNSSAQHIWNIGEGAGSSDDNIYLRTNQFNALYFGWGRNGALNEQLVVSNLGTAAYYGCYIGFNGRRLSGNDATAANLAQCFDIKLMFNNGGNWIFNPNPGAFGAGTWGTTGGRMDRAVTGDLTIGGRGTNRSYHGKVASFVTTTLNTNTDMPDSTEITKMVTDPLGWMDTYKVGSSFRRSQYSSGTIAWDTANNSNRTMGTQIYLMGDGTNDSYSNGIRNQVAPTDNNYTKLNMLGMVSNDIQTVNIPGLT